jgi:hypothetical protein
MTPSNQMPIPDFLALREQFYAHMANDLVNDSHRAMEAIRRVQELDWILRRCQSLEATAVALHDAHDEPARKQHSAALLELRILLEAFYQSAWRVIVLLDDRDKPFEGVGKLKRKCNGVRNVRNHLIDHPEKESRIFVQNFSYGDPEGPKLKFVHQGETVFAEDGSPLSSLEPANPANRDWLDEGLYVNAAEMVKVLGGMLSKPAPRVAS